MQDFRCRFTKYSPDSAQQSKPDCVYSFIRWGAHRLAPFPSGSLSLRTASMSISLTRSVSAIDTKPLKLVGVIPMGEVPKRINTLVVR
jgi:hypothetical protein